MSWRNTIRVAPLFVLAAALLSLKSIGLKAAGSKSSAPQKGAESDGKGGKDKDAPPARRSIGNKLQWIATSVQFWRVSLASACLLVSKGFEAIAPLFISNVLKLSSSSSAMLVATIPGGIVASVFFGEKYLKKLSIEDRGKRINQLCGLNCATSFIICGLTTYAETNEALSPAVAVALFGTLFFSLGFSAGYCFYVPQSVFFIEFGGDDSATVIGCSELIQAVVASSSVLLAGYVSTHYGWRYVWGMIVSYGAVAAISMSAFQRVLIEENSAKKTDKKSS
jgi:hypothetical protein